MNFQGLSKVEDPDFYIDVSFRAASKRGDQLRGEVSGTRIEKSKKIEIEKLIAIKNTACKHLMTILQAFPSLDGMAEFYQEMVKATLDYEKLKQSLGGVNWAMKRIADQTTQSAAKIKRTEELEKINAIRREYYGRFSSVLKQIGPDLKRVDDARKKMREFPSIKQNMFTVAIAGFPNIGKTTLLSKITPANPQIANYSFTTIGLNIGYIKNPKVKIQLIDTPGTLDRFEVMNPVEKQAHLAVKYCADLIVYVIDVTEPYPMEDQLHLMDELKKFHKDMIIYYSKADIADMSLIEPLKAKFGGFTDAAELEKDLIARASTE